MRQIPLPIERETSTLKEICARRLFADARDARNRRSACAVREPGVGAPVASAPPVIRRDNEHVSKVRFASDAPDPVGHGGTFRSGEGIRTPAVMSEPRGLAGVRKPPR